MSSFQFPNNPFGNRGTGGATGPGRRRGPGTLGYFIIALVVVLGILVSLTGFYTNLLWFRSVNFTQVWKTTLFTKIELFAFFGVVTSAIVTSNIYIAYRRRPIYVPMSA